jgi:eukaryotic-like serine/threonine-protein kinase
MPDASTCPSCGADLPPDAPQGLCPRCLYRLGSSPDPEDPGGPPDQCGSVETHAAGAAGDALPNLPAPSAIPTCFGDYEILEEMGHGGMGVVYRARQRSLDRLVALKLLLFGVRAPPELVKRFRAEAVATAALQHPNIVPIHEVGFCEGQHFIAMDYIEGRSLASLIRGNPLPARRAAGYLKTIAEAVHYAHERGILHRDLKPANVLVDTNDQPHVTDFGLAKRFDDDSELTLTGQMVGSPNYMPPEQAAGKRRTASRRTDVYALGATLYHALTGRPPFVGEGLADTVQQVLHVEPLSPRVLKPSVPADLETICLKCLEKEPSKRYATAQLLAEELARFLEGKPVLARPVSRVAKGWRWCRRSPVLAGLTAGLVAAFALGTGGVVFEMARAERHAREESRQRLRAEQNTYAADMKAAQVELQRGNRSLTMALLRQYLPQPGKGDFRTLEWRYLWQECQPDPHLSLPHPEPVGDVAFSPDGHLLATCTWGVDWKTRVWDLRTTNVIQEFRGGGTESPKRSLAFSPDGNWLVLRGPNGIEVRATDGWTLRREFNDVSGGSPWCLSANGQVLVLCSEKALQAWDFVSGTCRMLTNTFASNFNLGISADGSRVICSDALAYFNNYKPTVLWDLDQDAPITLPIATDVTSLAITPNGAWAASGHYMGEIKLWNLDTQESIALEAESLGRAHRFSALCVTFSPDGERLAAAGSDEVIRIWETASGKLLRTLRWHAASIWGLAFSSDGQQLASTSTDGTARVWNIEAPPSPAFSRLSSYPPTPCRLAFCATRQSRHAGRQCAVCATVELAPR